MRIEDCVVCKSSSFADNAHDDNDISLHYFVCPRCGKYFITDFAKDTIEGAWGLDERGIAHYLSSNDDALDPKSQTALYVEVAKKAADGKGTDLPRSIISHVVRKNVGKTPTILRIEYLVNILKNNSALTPAELANNVVLFLGARLLSPGSRLQMPPPQENIYGLLGIKIGETEGNDLDYILVELASQNVLRRLESPIRYSFTLPGWQRYQELLRSVKDSRKAFVAMEFPDESRSRDYFFQNTLLDEFLVPAVKKTGYRLANAMRSDPKAGNLHARLEVEIRAAQFVVAELSHHNNGAYWEAGFARGLGKPVIYMFNKKIAGSERPPHFDVGSDLYILWDHEEPGKAAEDLKAVIRATFFGEAIMED